MAQAAQEAENLQNLSMYVAPVELIKLLHSLVFPCDQFAFAGLM